MLGILIVTKLAGVPLDTSHTENGCSGGCMENEGKEVVGKVGTFGWKRGQWRPPRQCFHTALPQQRGCKTAKSERVRVEV